MCGMPSDEATLPIETHCRTLLALLGGSMLCWLRVAGAWPERQRCEKCRRALEVITRRREEMVRLGFLAHCTRKLMLRPNRVDGLRLLTLLPLLLLFWDLGRPQIWVAHC